MPSIPNLPKKRLIRLNKHYTYKLKDFIGKNDEFIKTANTGTILVDYTTLIDNFDLLKHIIELLDVTQINCLDYESAVFLENNLEPKVDLALVDDYENKERSYIDTSKFVKHDFYVPLSYFMWGIKFKNSCNIRCLRYKEYDTMTSINGDNVLYRETLERLKEIIQSIAQIGLSDIDKCILISNYLQSKVQYVESGLKQHADRVYVIEADENDVTSQKVGSVNSVINENYGLCMAIANTTTLLLNNPIMNINVRSLYGDSHVWNIITIDGKQYYIDNTWAITRNKNRVEEALKATSFSIDYLLFGSKTAENIGHHRTLCYFNGELAQEDYNKEDIQARIKVLSKKHTFTNYDKTLKFKSKIQTEC